MAGTRAAKRRSRGRGGAKAPLLHYRCLKCGHLINTAEDARDHRQMALFGVNTCRKLFGDMQPPRGSVVGTRPAVEIRDPDSIKVVVRSGWDQEIGQHEHPITGEPHSPPRVTTLWRVQRAVWA